MSIQILSDENSMMQTLSDKSLMMQVQVINAANDAKQFIADALFRKREGMEMVQSALPVTAALIAAYALFELFVTVKGKFESANKALNKYQ